MLTPPYSVIVPALPRYIVTVGYPDLLAFADTATEYQVFAEITALVVQKLVLLLSQLTHKLPAVPSPTSMLRSRDAPAPMLITGICRPYSFCTPVPVGAVIRSEEHT